MKSIREITFQNAYCTNDQMLKEEVILFWKKSDVLDDFTRQQRADEVVYIVRDGESNIIGVSTVAKMIHEPLDNYIYLFRCFIAAIDRAPGLDTQLIIKTKDFLESIYNTETPMAVGLLVVVQSEQLKKWNKAVWSGSDMMYIGNTTDGDPVRIYYFKGAKI